MGKKKDPSRKPGFNKGKDGKFTTAPQREPELPTAIQMVEASRRSQLAYRQESEKEDGIALAHEQMQRALTKKVDTGRPVRDAYANLSKFERGTLKGISLVTSSFGSYSLAQMSQTIPNHTGQLLATGGAAVLGLPTASFVFDLAISNVNKAIDAMRNRSLSVKPSNFIDKHLPVIRRIQEYRENVEYGKTTIQRKTANAYKILATEFAMLSTAGATMALSHADVTQGIGRVSFGALVVGGVLSSVQYVVNIKNANESKPTKWQANADGSSGGSYI